jgi:hypothetical protein
MITNELKVRARHHLGYLGVQESATFQLGVPAAVQTQFMIEGAWDKLLPESEALFARIVCRLDAIEEEVYGGIDMASVLQVGAIQVNPKRFSELSKYYVNARLELSNLLGCPPNPFDGRPLASGGGAVGNVRTSY